MFLSHRGGQTMEMNIVTVYDIQNKFIAYSAPFPDVIDVLSEWGCVYILGGDRKVRGHSGPDHTHFLLFYVSQACCVNIVWNFTFFFFTDISIARKRYSDQIRDVVQEK